VGGAAKMASLGYWYKTGLSLIFLALAALNLLCPDLVLAGDGITFNEFTIAGKGESVVWVVQCVSV
jgi:hypothetical protein